MPFVDVPVSFTIPDEGGTQSTTAVVPATVPTPIGSISVIYDLVLSTDGDTLSITGTGSGDTGIVAVEQSLGSDFSALPIAAQPLQTGTSGAERRSWTSVWVTLAYSESSLASPSPSLWKNFSTSVAAPDEKV